MKQQRGGTTPATPDRSAESDISAAKARIRDAAAFVLSTKGYAGLRLEEVAERAGLRPPTIYHHYGSRDELIEEVMWSGAADMRIYLQEILERLPGTASPTERLMAAVEAHLRHELELSDYAQAAMRNSRQVPPEVRRRQLREEELYGAIWRNLINDLAVGGILWPDLDVYVARMLVLGSLNWALFWWSPRNGSIDGLIANAQSFVRHALTTAPRTNRRRTRGRA